MTIFEFAFTQIVQNSFYTKFSYTPFLTKNCDTYKFRNSLTITKFRNIPVLYQVGEFVKKNNIQWIIYIPLIKNNSNDMKDIFLNNLRQEVDDIYLLLVNLYESIPKNNEYFLELSHIFYNLLLLSSSEKEHHNRLDIYPTLCKIPTSKIKYTRGKFLSLINDNDNIYLRNFMKTFEGFIMEKKYNPLLNNCKQYLNNNNDLLKSFTILINRCKLDENPAFLYSNLGKDICDLISKYFLLNLDINKITMLFNLVQLPRPSLPSLRPPPPPPSLLRCDDENLSRHL